MLDILGNVFGKNKKSNNASSSNHNGSNEETNENEASDGYVFVSHNEPQRTTPYQQATILTDELIRMGSSSSMLPANNHHAGSVYPNLDSNGGNPSLPFSSSSRSSLSVMSMNTSNRTASPIDNVPFSLSVYSGNGSSNAGADDDGDVGDTLNRIYQFVNNPNLSEYSFKLENAILRESLLT